MTDDFFRAPIINSPCEYREPVSEFLDDLEGAAPPLAVEVRVRERAGHRTAVAATEWYMEHATSLVRCGMKRRALRLAGIRGMTYHHTYAPMPKDKIAVTIDHALLQRVDRLVRSARYPNRSQAIEAAVGAQLDRLERRRLAEECAKLDPRVERAMAEEGMHADAREWPEY